MERPLCGCGCGCGTEMSNPKRWFIQGHDAKTKPAHLTLEARGMTNGPLADELAKMCQLHGGANERLGDVASSGRSGD